MAGIPTATVEVDLDSFGAWLTSEDSPEESMLLSGLDGFLTGIGVGPDMILPAEWMPRIWGGEKPVFASFDQARLIIGSIAGRFDPLVGEGLSGNPLVSDWAAGFRDAVILRPHEWEARIGDEEVAARFRPVLLLGQRTRSIRRSVPPRFRRIRWTRLTKTRRRS